MAWWSGLNLCLEGKLPLQGRGFSSSCLAPQWRQSLLLQPWKGWMWNLKWKKTKQRNINIQSKFIKQFGNTTAHANLRSESDMNCNCNWIHNCNCNFEVIESSLNNSVISHALSCTVEPRYNKGLWTMKITLLHVHIMFLVISGYKKTQNIKRWEQQNYFVIDRVSLHPTSL